MSKISNDNVLCYAKIKETTACLQMHYVMTIHVSFGGISHCGSSNVFYA